MTRLSSTVLPDLPAHIKQPVYDRNACGVGIVHLGIGTFHRAHQAVYTDDVLEMDGGDWSIMGVSLCHKDVHDQLVPQDGLYTVTALEGESRQCRVVGSVKDVVFAPEEGEPLLFLMMAETTKIVSLTVTEKGYYRDPARGTLLRDDLAIAADLKNPTKPNTAIGYLVQALGMRRKAGIPPFTVLSCDNLSQNGHSLRRIVLEYAELVEAGLASWIEKNVAFPCTMVDRIVPATTEEGLSSVANDIGVRDEGAILTEPFIQWVIEDNFTMDRPAWEKAGAMIVADVTPYELIKLRLLNGSHSSLAYLGYLSGMEYVSDCMNNKVLRKFTNKLMHEEIKPTVSAPEGFDIDFYIQSLLARFNNPSLHHRCWQIAMDGSQKLPQRLLDTVRDRLQAGQPYDRIALAIAGWIQYVSGFDLDGKKIDVRDPLSDLLTEKLTPGRGNATQMVEAALQVEDVFGSDLGTSTAFHDAVVKQLDQLLTEGCHWAGFSSVGSVAISPR